MNSKNIVDDLNRRAKAKDIDEGLCLALCRTIDLITSLENENRELRRDNKRLQGLCKSAHSAIDVLMGDSDLPNDSSDLMKLMQQLAVI